MLVHPDAEGAAVAQDNEEQGKEGSDGGGDREAE